jgi:hypothetical protein
MVIVHLAFVDSEENVFWAVKCPKTHGYQKDTYNEGITKLMTI